MKKEVKMLRSVKHKLQRVIDDLYLDYHGEVREKLYNRVADELSGTKAVLKDIEERLIHEGEFE